MAGSCGLEEKKVTITRRLVVPPTTSFCGARDNAGELAEGSHVKPSIFPKALLHRVSLLQQSRYELERAVYRHYKAETGKCALDTVLR